VNADGTGLLRLTMDPEWAGIGVSNVAWSPDGSNIAFVGVNGPLEVVDVDGTDRNTIADVCKVWPPDPISWSPDGKKIAYCASPPDGGSEVYVSNANGSGQTRLTYGSALGSFPGSAPNWSPDGSKLAYQRETATPYPGTTYPKWDVHVINADGSGDVSLTEKLPGGLYPSGRPSERDSPSGASPTVLRTRST
jgi:Tol biopolymer transport system component